MKKQTDIIITFNAIYFNIILSTLFENTFIKISMLVIAVFSMIRYMYLINKHDI